MRAISKASFCKSQSRLLARNQGTVQDTVALEGEGALEQSPRPSRAATEMGGSSELMKHATGLHRGPIGDPEGILGEEITSKHPSMLLLWAVTMTDL